MEKKTTKNRDATSFEFLILINQILKNKQKKIYGIKSNLEMKKVKSQLINSIKYLTSDELESFDLNNYQEKINDVKKGHNKVVLVNEFIKLTNSLNRKRSLIFPNLVEEKNNINNILFKLSINKNSIDDFSFDINFTEFEVQYLNIFPLLSIFLKGNDINTLSYQIIGFLDYIYETTYDKKQINTFKDFSINITQSSLINIPSIRNFKNKLNQIKSNIEKLSKVNQLKLIRNIILIINENFYNNIPDGKLKYEYSVRHLNNSFFISLIKILKMFDNELLVNYMINYMCKNKNKISHLIYYFNSELSKDFDKINNSFFKIKKNSIDKINPILIMFLNNDKFVNEFKNMDKLISLLNYGIFNEVKKFFNQNNIKFDNVILIDNILNEKLNIEELNDLLMNNKCINYSSVLREHIKNMILKECNNNISEVQNFILSLINLLISDGKMNQAFIITKVYNEFDFLKLYFYVLLGFKYNSSYILAAKNSELYERKIVDLLYKTSEYINTNNFYENLIIKIISHFKILQDFLNKNSKLGFINCQEYVMGHLHEVNTKPTHYKYDIHNEFDKTQYPIKVSCLNARIIYNKIKKIINNSGFISDKILKEIILFKDFSIDDYRFINEFMILGMLGNKEYSVIHHQLINSPKLKKFDEISLI